MLGPYRHPQETIETAVDTFATGSYGGAPRGYVGIVRGLETVCPGATLPEVQSSRRAIAD